MMRGSKQRFFTRVTAVLFAAGELLLCDFNSANAARPSPPPPPPGTIYFYYGTSSSIYSMSADGSGRSLALPAAPLINLNPGFAGGNPWAGRAVPAGLLSGGQRWFITTAQTGTYDEVISSSGVTYTDYPHYDLVAVRRRPSDSSQLDVVQLTDLFGVFRVLPHYAYWSNDSNEDLLSSFAAAIGVDIRAGYIEDEDGTFVDFQQQSPATVRVPITVSEIAAGAAVPVDGTLTNEEIDAFIWPTITTNGFNQGTTSLFGDQTVVARQGTRLMLVDSGMPDYSNPVQFLWDGSVSAPTQMTQVQWSPDGLTIAVAADDGNVWTVKVSGATPPKKILSTTTVTTKKGSSVTSRYTNPIWSPDSQYLAATRDDSSTTTIVGSAIVRIPASGGTPVELSGSLPTDSGGRPIRWVSN